MVGALQGGAVLLLLSVFFAHVLAPAVAALRRRVRIGPRQRPISRPVAILLLYLAVFVPGALVWRGAQDNAVHWVRVTAPAVGRAAVQRRQFRAVRAHDRARRRFPTVARRGLVVRLEQRGVSYVERKCARRSTS